MARRRIIAIAVLSLLVIVATVLSLVLTVGNQAPAKLNESQDDRPEPDATSKPRSITKPHLSTFNKTRKESDLEKEMKLPNPTSETYSITALAIGDWGRTIMKKGGSCCSRRDTYTIKDYNAMEYTASLLGLAAAEAQPKPSVIISHGDNFYWLGLMSSTDQAYRFEETFEKKYADASLQGIPWINVLGNHDYGGASYICSQNDVPTECSSSEELIYHLNQKFALQSEYVSPNDNRWRLPDHFFVHSLEDPATGLRADIFNMDTNDADSHGATQICCQCYGYAGGDDDSCENVMRGDKYCAGGNTGMYDACMKQLKDWAMDSRQQLKEAVKASTATWKLVNTHYGPYNHYAPEKAEEWRELLDGLGVQLFMFGHTHGEKHDYAAFKTHFIENGAGGGIQNESPSGTPPYAKDYIENVWSAGNYPYGIFSLAMSENWLQARFFTFDDSWVMNMDIDKSVVGGIDEQHCWYIPKFGSKGRNCYA